MALRTVGVKLTADVAGYVSNIKRAQDSTRSFAGELSKNASAGKLDAVADRAAVMGTVLTGVFAYAVKSAADFDKAMSSVSAATHANTKDLGDLRAAALQAGKDTMYSATEAANGITELSKAGVSTANILGGGLKGALSLAAAGQLAVGDAAEIAASAMTQFKLSGDQVPHVADLLAAGAGKAQGSVKDMGMALNQSGLVAAQFGLSIEDTTGALGEFASAGLLGSDAGTSLKTMLLAIANPSKQTQTAMDSLGISFYDAQGKFVGLNGVAQVLQTRLKGLTDQQRQATLGQIFGSDAIRSASILYNDGAAGVEKWKNSVNDSGYAAETAQKQTDNLAGDIERLKGSFETLAIEGGNGPNKGLRLIAQVLNTIVTQFANLNPVVSEIIVVMAGLGGALLLGTAAWIKYRSAVTKAQEQLIATGPAGEKAAGALGKMSSALGKIGMWAAIAEGISLVFDQIDTKTDDVNKLTDSVQNLFNTGKTSGELKDVFGDNWDKLGRIAGYADSADHGFGKFVGGVENSIPIFGSAAKSLGNFGSRLIAGTDFDSAKANMADLDTSLSTNITSIHDYAKASAIWQQALSKSGLNAQQLAQLLPNTYKELGVLSAESENGGKALNKFSGSAAGSTGKLGDLNSALSVGADAQNKYATEAEAVAGAARGERAALDALHQMLKAETDPVFALIDAQQKLKDAHNAATKATKAHGKGSAEARAADLELAKAALNLQDATGSLTQSFNGKLDPAFVATMKAAGLTKGQIADVEKQFGSAKKSADAYDGKYKADTSAPGAPKAKADIDKAHKSAVTYDGKYNAVVTVTGADGVAQKLYGLTKFQAALASGAKVSVSATKLFHGLATGGSVSGPGTGTSDSIPVLLSNGEYVIKASSVASLGQDRLDHMNETGKLPGYASGGRVWPFPATAKNTKIPSKKSIEGATSISGGVGGTYAGGGSLGAWIMRAMSLTGVPASWAPPLHVLIMRESGGNPNSINLTDSNARAGHPSQGLMQTIPGTFNAYALPGLGGITNPVANIVAGIRYILSRYGSIFNVQQANPNLPPKGYARGGHVAMAHGGLISEPIFGVGKSGRTYTFGEMGPETVTPGKYASGGLISYAGSTAGNGGTRNDTVSAALAARDAIDQLSASIKSNGRYFSQATAKGRDNVSQTLQVVQAAQAAAKAKFDETGSVSKSNKVYSDYMKLLDSTLKKMKVNGDTRKWLIKTYSEQPSYSIPDSSSRISMVQGRIGAQEQVDAAKNAFAWTKPTFSSTTESGRAELNQLFSYLSAAEQAAQSEYDFSGSKGKANAVYAAYTKQLTTILRKYMSAAAVTTLLNAYGKITLTKSNRWGGLYHAATGTLRDAQVASGGPTQYAWAEASTGGELFAPKNGNLAKTRSEVGWAVANWWGGQVNWQKGSSGQNSGAGRAITIDATIPITLGSETIIKQVHLEVDTALGQVAAATVYQTA